MWLSIRVYLIISLSCCAAVIAGELVPLYPKIIRNPNIEGGNPRLQPDPWTDDYLSHFYNEADYYLGSGAEDDTFFVVFEPGLSCSVLYAEVQWLYPGQYLGFGALYSEEAAAVFPLGQAPPRGTTDISPIGEIFSGWTVDSCAATQEWELFNFGEPFYVGDSATHVPEMFGLGFVKPDEDPKLLADHVNEFGSVDYTYSWFGGPWMPNNGYEHVWGAYSSDFSGIVIEYMIRVWVDYQSGTGCCDLFLTPDDPPITIPSDGGSFEFSMTAINNHSYGVAWDIWTTITMPDSSVFGPIIELYNHLLPASGYSLFEETQVIPADWPAGTYTYNAYIGYSPYPSAEDHFSFTKAEPAAVEAQSVEIQAGLDNIAVQPNPFNQRSLVSFTLARDGYISLKVFDISGREVASLVTGHLSSGAHEVVWDAEGMGSGVYFVRLELQSAGTLLHSTRKVVLVK